MRSGWFFLVACLSAIPGCGSDTNGTGTNGAGGGGATDLTPASNIDVTRCAAIQASASDATSANRCSTCCKAQPGNVASSFINDNQCTCAAPRANDEGETICASATADGDTCSACCSNHDYLLAGWVGAGATTAATCACGNLRDSTVCAASSKSEAACESCCIHEGFIGTGFGLGMCACVGP